MQLAFTAAQAAEKYKRQYVCADGQFCQSAPKLFHPSASNSFQFFWFLDPFLAVFKSVKVVTSFQNVAVEP